MKSRDIYLGTATQVIEKIRGGQHPQAVDVKEFGLVMAALREAERIGLVDVIDRLLPKRKQGCTVGQYILIAALNKIASPTSRNGGREWLLKTVLPERLGIDPKRDWTSLRCSATMGLLLSKIPNLFHSGSSF